MTEPSATLRMQAHSLKKILLFVCKLLIAVALMYYLIHTGKINLDAFEDIQWSAGNIFLMLAGIAAVLVGLFLLSLRLKFLLGICHVNIPILTSLRLTVIGAFAGVLLPGLVGGDAVKAVYLCCGDAKHHKNSAVSIVVFDRIIGITGLLLLGSLALGIFAISGKMHDMSLVFMLPPILVLCVFVGFAFFTWRRVAKNKLFLWFFHKMPVRIQRLITEFRTIARSPATILLALLLSVLNHLLVCCTFIIAARLLAVKTPGLMLEFVINPIAMVMNVVPLSPGGIGVTESVFDYLYQTVGISQGADIGLMGRIIQYISFAIPAIPAIVMANKNGRSISE